MKSQLLSFIFLKYSVLAFSFNPFTFQLLLRVSQYLLGFHVHIVNPGSHKLHKMNEYYENEYLAKCLHSAIAY